MRRSLALVVAVLATVTAHIDAAAGAPGARDRNSPWWAHASDGRVPSWARETGGAPSAPSSGSWLDGVDVSHWQGTIDWSKVAGAGKTFVIMKATDGTSY